VAGPNIPQIGLSSETIDAIDVPEGEFQSTDPFHPVASLLLSRNHKVGPTRATRVVGSLDHALLPVPPRKTVIPAMDFLSCYAIAVNEVNASGGRIVTSPTNGAAGVIPAVLKYIVEVRSVTFIMSIGWDDVVTYCQFVSDDPEKSVTTFLLTAAVSLPLIAGIDNL
jgi:hypothetical protein